MGLILLALGLGAFSILTTAIITRRYFTPCLWYWLGWLIGLTGAELSWQVGVLPAVTPYGQELILRTHLGAVIGFLVASMWFRTLPRRNRPVQTDLAASQALRLPRWIWLLIAFQACLGVYLLAERLLAVGAAGLVNLFDIRQSFLQETYLQDNLPPVLRLYQFVSLASSVVPVLLAQIDAKNKKINFTALALIFLATVPGGISTGGRVWIVSSFSLYAVSYFITIDRRLKWRRVLRIAQSFLVPVLVLIMIFTAIGLVRDNAFIEGLFGSGGDFAISKALSPLYIYMGITVSAAGPYSEFAAQQDLGYGQFSFPWFADQLIRLGLLSESRYVDYVRNSRLFVTLVFDPVIGSTHASIIPNLIADFGENNLLVSVAVLMGVLQALFLIVRKDAAWGQVLATVICLYGGAFAFQDTLVGTSSAIFPVIASVIFSLVPHRRPREAANWRIQPS